MEERNDNEKMDEMLLPGFRFHPTDEELVGFYLKKKIQQQPPSIELIRQLDIYKYDPWDLPKLASTGEKEWYFYCPRDRKYRNSARPNRVTGAGFWKATGTDRPIYSSESSKCIGLKKSLVFYRGRAAKGVKTDWMMHEFRLPSLTDTSQAKRYMDKSIPANDSWAVVKIFKKTNSNAQRALSNSWVSPLPEYETTPHDDNNPKDEYNSTQFNSKNMTFSARTTSSTPFCYSNSLPQLCAFYYSPNDFSTYKPPSYPLTSKVAHFPVSSIDIPTSFMFSSLEASSPVQCTTVDVPTMMLNMSSTEVLGGFGKYNENIGFAGSEEQNNRFLMNVPQDVQLNNTSLDENEQLDTLSTAGFPFSTLPVSMGDNAWKPSFHWDSLPCPSDINSNFCTTKCYT